MANAVFGAPSDFTVAQTNHAVGFNASTDTIDVRAWKVGDFTALQTLGMIVTIDGTVAIKMVRNGLNFVLVLDGVTDPTVLTAAQFVFSAPANDGSDTVNASESVDVVSGGFGNDTLNGNGSNDILAGGAGDDTLSGGVLNDTLDGGTGSDRMAGDSWDDTYILRAGDGGTADNPDIITENIGDGTDTIRIVGLTPDKVLMYDSPVADHVRLALQGDGGTYTYVDIYAPKNSDGSASLGSRIESIVFDDATAWNLTAGLPATGTSGADTLTGSNGSDVLIGLGGNDVINGFNGDDSLSGGVGDDTLAGGVFNDTLDGGIGSDRMAGESWDDTYVLRAGDGGTADNPDIVTENIGDGTDTIRIVGLTPDKVLMYDSPRDENYVRLALQGDGGTYTYVDIYAPKIEDGSASLGSRIESIVFDDATTWNLTTGLPATGTSGADMLTGSNSNDTLIGMDGSDVINGFNGYDSLSGGAGDDTLSGGVLNDTLDGGTGSDRMAGDSWDDTYILRAGDGGTADNPDIITENISDGTDTIRIVGLTPDKVLMYDSPVAGYVRLALQGDDGSYSYVDIYAPKSDDGSASLGSRIEFIAFDGDVTWNLTQGLPATGTSGADTLTGSNSNDTLIGMDGSDVINGFNGYDSLSGGAGDDTLSGGVLNDTLDGGTGSDRMAGDSWDDTYILRAGDGGTADNPDIITENIGDGTDTIRIVGLTPDKVLMYDSPVADYVRLALPSDDGSYTYVDIYAPKNSDGSASLGSRIEFIAFDGDVTWNLTQGLPETGTPVGDTLTGSNGNDVLAGMGGGDVLKGFDGYDSLSGGAGDDTLSGGVLNDTLDGGTGSDRMAGDSWDDTYVLRAGDGGTADNPDIITENVGDGTDTIRILGLTPDDVLMYRSPVADHVRLALKAGDGSYSFVDIYAPSDSLSSRVEKIVFDDGTTWNTNSTLPQSDALVTVAFSHGTPANDIATISYDPLDPVVIDPSNPGSSDPGLLLVTSNGAVTADPLTGLFHERNLILVPASADGAPVDINLPIRVAPASGGDLNVAVLDPDGTIDWAGQKADLKPEGMSDAVWNRVFSAFTASVGTTTGSLTAELAENATLLTSFGINGQSAAMALAFELEQAADFGSLEARGDTGSLGQGWRTIADVAVTEIADGLLEIEGLTDFSALFSLSGAAAARYTLSASVGRSIDLSGSISDAAPRPIFFTLNSDNKTYSGPNGEVLTINKAGEYLLTTTNGATLRFAADGQLIDATNAMGDVTTAAYDAKGQMTGLSNEAGRTLSFAYDTAGRVTEISDSTGYSVDLTYSADGKTLASAERAGGKTDFTFNASGDLAKADPAGGTGAESFTYDSQGRLSGIDLGGLVGETYSYNGSGGYTVVDGAGNEVDVTLLQGGLVASSTDALGNTTGLTFDEEGHITGMRNAGGDSSIIELDDAGRIVKVTTTTGAVLTRTYEGNSTLPSSMTDANGETRTFAYDADGHLTKATWPDGTVQTYSYDAKGNIASYTNRGGDGVNYTYDTEGNLTSVSDSSAGAVTYTYDDDGNMTSATTADGTTNITWSDADRITSITWPDGRSLTYAYDDAGRRTSMTDEGGRGQTYSYDAAGRLATIGDETGVQVTYEYDAAGRLAGEENANGTSTNYTYDAAGRVLSIVNLAADDTENSHTTYTYDAVGLRTSMDTQDGKWVYGYDAAGQLTSADFTSSRAGLADKSLAYSYDAAGNRISSVEDGVTTNYVVNALNQYVSAGEATYTYDASGNMLTRVDASGTTRYAYDAMDRLTSVTGTDGKVTSYEYDVFGNRSAVVENGVRTSYLVDPSGLGSVVAQYGADGALTASYLNGLGLAAQRNAGGGLAFYDTDGVGSVTGVTNAAGTQVNSYGYTPYGTTLFETEGVVNAYEFNGGLGVSEDASGLFYMRARQYDAELGRFTTEDALWLTGDVANLYRFALNDPVSSADPSGNIVLSLGGGLSGYMTGGGGWGGGLYFDTDNLEVGIYASVEGGGGVGAGAAANFGVSRDASTFNGASLNAGGGAGPFSGNAQISSDGSLGGVAWTPQLGAGGSVTASYTGSGKLFSFDFFPPDRSDEHWKAPKIPPKNPDNTDDDEQHDDGAGETVGDPHLRTFDGLAYDFQAAGEFTLARVAKHGFEVQVRQEAVPGTSVALNTAVAMRFGDAVAEYDAKTHRLLINGEEVTLESGRTIAVGDGAIYRSGSEYTFAGAYGESVIVTDAGGFGGVQYLNIRTLVTVADEGAVAGLLGNNDENPDNDIALSDGTVLTGPIASNVLYGAYADSWRVTDATSLFTYAEGESTATHTNRDFPIDIVTIDDLPADARAAAEQAATNAGLVPGTVAYNNAVLDMALTGDSSFVTNAAAAEAENPTTEEPEVLAINSAPTGPTTAFADGTEDEAYTITKAALIAGFADKDEGDTPSLVPGLTVSGSATVAETADGTGYIITPVKDFYGEMTLTYYVADQRGATATVNRIVDFAAVNDAPTDITLSATTVEENAVGGTVIGTLTGVDPDDAATALAFSIVTNPDNAFAINNGILVVAEGAKIDYEANPTYEVVVRVTDSGGLTRDEAFIIAVTDAIDRVVGTNKADKRLDGAAGADLIEGLGGNDTINGLAGNDTIAGGRGVDKLTGGADADTFVFLKGDTGKKESKADTIFDFKAREGDIIDLADWDANSKRGGDQDFDFIGKSKFSGDAGELRFVKERSDTWIMGDTNGDKKADFLIHLDDAVTMKAGYFEGLL